MMKRRMAGVVLTMMVVLSTMIDSIMRVNAFQPTTGLLPRTGSSSTTMQNHRMGRPLHAHLPSKNQPHSLLVKNDEATSHPSKNESPRPRSRTSPPAWLESVFQSVQTSAMTSLLGLSILGTSVLAVPFPAGAAAANPSTEIVSCLFQKCSLQLGKCILNPKCLANVVCINTCTGRPDEIGCQIQCGDYFENEVVGEFNSTLC